MTSSPCEFCWSRHRRRSANCCAAALSRRPCRSNWWKPRAVRPRATRSAPMPSTRLCSTPRFRPRNAPPSSTRRDRSEHKPFVFLVAATMEEAQRLAERGGADSVVVKPADVERGQGADRALRAAAAAQSRAGGRRFADHAQHRAQDPGGQPLPARAVRGAGRVDALRQIASGKFDLVFLDYNMPGLNGVETLSEIKRQSPDLHVVIMTSTADDDRRRARAPRRRRGLPQEAVLSGRHRRDPAPHLRAAGAVAGWISRRRRRTARCRRARCRGGRTSRRRTPPCPCSRRR